MKAESVKLVYFSPTKTTKAVVSAIARGMSPVPSEVIDITLQDARKKPLNTSENELLIIGVPVYMGRVPALLTEWLNMIRAHNTPAVCVVVYGNRVYEDALTELADIMKRRGCIPVAGAAYIGEHSFSTEKRPTAKGRPDAEDLRHAEIFGQKIKGKLENIPSPDQISELNIPGCRPYRGDSKLWIVDFIEVSDECTQCGICAEGCPVGAIDLNNSRTVDTAKCITCCACIKNCLVHAKSMKPGMVSDASERLFALYKERKVPEYFL